MKNVNVKYLLLHSSDPSEYCPFLHTLLPPAIAKQDVVVIVFFSHSSAQIIMKNYFLPSFHKKYYEYYIFGKLYLTKKFHIFYKIPTIDDINFVNCFYLNFFQIFDKILTIYYWVMFT